MNIRATLDHIGRKHLIDEFRDVGATTGWPLWLVGWTVPGDCVRANSDHSRLALIISLVVSET